MEITESVTASDAPHSLALFKSWKALGVKISIDDFGTGFPPSPIFAISLSTRSSSIAVSSPTSKAKKGTLSIAKAVVAISSGAITVAKGIETENHAATVTELGFGLGQRYHHGRTLTLDAVHALSAFHQPHEASVHH